MMSEHEAQAEARAAVEMTDAGAGSTTTAPAGIPGAPTGDALRELVKDVMEQHDLKQDATAREIGRSASALNQWLSGKYKGDVTAVEADIQKWLARRADTAAFGPGLRAEPRFVETPAAKAYLSTLRYTQSGGNFGLIYGASGAGKTRAVKHYATIRPNVWVLTASPADKTLVPFLKRLARAIGIGDPGNGASEITDAIIAKVQGTGGLIVVDEADHVDLTAIEQLRFIHDQTRIGVVLVGNDVIYTNISGGTRRAEFARLYSRVGKRQRAFCTREDIEAVARSMAIAGREEIAFLKSIGLRSGALRNVIQVIQQAAIRAAGKGEDLSKDHLELAWNNLGAED